MSVKTTNLVCRIPHFPIVLTGSCPLYLLYLLFFNLKFKQYVLRNNKYHTYLPLKSMHTNVKRYLNLVAEILQMKCPVPHVPEPWPCHYPVTMAPNTPLTVHPCWTAGRRDSKTLGKKFLRQKLNLLLLAEVIKGTFFTKSNNGNNIETIIQYGQSQQVSEKLVTNK